MNHQPRVALIHDWLTGLRGGEKVLEVFCELFPNADIFTLLHIPNSTSPKIESHRIHTSYLQKMPFIQKKYRHYLPLMPDAIESISLKGYDFIISTSHCVAKGVIPSQNAKHISCCFTPMRYIWDQYDQYFGPESPFIVRTGMKLLRPHLQLWDQNSSQRVHSFIAISQFVADRITKYYNRESTVIFPPVNTDFYTPLKTEPTLDYFLIVSALVPYKRINIAVQSFNKNKKPLKIIGTGPELGKLKSIAQPNIEFLGWGSDQDLRKHYQNCKALIFPGIEDFGIVPIENMACARPVIAYRKGGVSETVVENKTGVFFNEQTSESLLNAIDQFENCAWDFNLIRNHALTFGYNRYTNEIKTYLNQQGLQLE